jgi:hypothetical protein
MWMAAAVAALTIGSVFPDLNGEFLTGKKASLPQAANGKVALVALGFTHASHATVSAWTSRFHKEFFEEPKAKFYQVPMLGGMAWLSRIFVESGLRKNNPKVFYEDIMPVYHNVDDWKKRIGYKGDDVAYVFLLDQNGVIRWMFAGGVDEREFAQMRDETRRLLSKN